MYKRDTINQHCTENNVLIPHPTLLEEHLTLEQSQIQEEYWINRLQEEGWIILNKAPTGKNKSSIGFNPKWTYDKCKEVAIHCKNKEELKKTNGGAYRAAYVNKWLSDFFIVTKKPNQYWETLENIQEVANKCKNKKDLWRKFPSAYNGARKAKLLNQLKFNK